MMRRRFILAGVVAAATLATLIVPVSRYAVWNATASVPTGLYAIRGKASLHVGERVAVEPPPPLRRLLAERHYLPTGVPLLKRIAAVSGQRVCRFAHGVTIDGGYVGTARARDRLGRPLPVWAGCKILKSGELFVMNPAAPDSFDGRYFGVLRLADVIGRATPVWTDEAGQGDHEWFADPRANPPTSSTTEGDRTMKIGYFVSGEDGFAGHITTLTLDIGVVLLPAEPSDNENAPDYRVIAGEGDEAREIGAGWKRTGEKAGDYVALQIDDPSFVQPLRANLFHDDGTGHVLVWSRPSRHDKAD